MLRFLLFACYFAKKRFADSGAIVRIQGYHPYGATAYQTGTEKSRYQFTGQEKDDTGLYYYNARYYDQDLGRFISVDPGIRMGVSLSLGETVNPYMYCENNPVKYTDPTGLSPFTDLLVQTAMVAAQCGMNKLMAEYPVLQDVRDVLQVAIGVVTIVDGAKNVVAGVEGIVGGIALAPETGGMSIAISAEGAALVVAGAAEVVAGAVVAGNALVSLGERPENLSPEGAGRQGALNQAKRDNDIPTSQQPESQGPNTDRQGNVQPGREYTYVDSEGNTVTIRDDAAGHDYGVDDSQNRGPHFNDENGGHYDY